MFLNYIKDYFLKRNLKNSLHNVVNISSEASIRTVGILIDESYFFEKDFLVKESIRNGIVKENIKIILYKHIINKSEVHSQPIFSIKDLNWNAEIVNPVMNDFIHYKFNLLISYYDVEKAILLNITNNLKALFKVGFHQ